MPQDPTSPNERTSPERIAFVALSALLLAPVLAHGAYRPWAHVVGPIGSAPRVTGAALAVAAIIVVAHTMKPKRVLIAGGLAAAGLSLLLSLGIPGVLTLLGVAAAIAWLVPWMSARLPKALDGLARRHKALAVLYALFAVLAIVWTARVSIFIGDPRRADMQALPGNTFVETHSCLTAYVRASSLARGGAENLYDDSWWHGSNGLPPLPEGAQNPYAPFDLDNFSYPPPFLLLTSPLAPLDGDFLAQRALWFGLNGLLLAAALWAVARFIDGPRAHRVLLLAPLLFGSMPFMLTLQIGNFHIASVALSLLAMVAIERGRTAAGGAGLALTILSKVSPGVLGIVLLARSQFRAAAATAAVGALLLAVSVIRFGKGPIESFVRYALPRLRSGRAFPFMDTESGVLTNMSPFGVPFKLQRLGVAIGDPWLIGARIAGVYTLALAVVAVLASRGDGDRRDKALRWMALLVLAALQSPFSPGYAVIALLWATTLLAVEVQRALHGIGLAALWLSILVVPEGLSFRHKLIQSVVQTTLILAFCGWLSVRAPRGRAAEPARVP